MTPTASRAKALARLVALVLVNLALLCLLAELSAIALGGRTERVVELPALPLSEHGAAARGWKLDPFAAFIVNPPGSPYGADGLVVNAQGFLSEHGDYPVPRRGGDDYLVGIFGGSVAQQLYAQGRHRLSEQLSRDPRLVGRNLTILSFAQPGYKQPQQLVLLARYLALGQALDLVVNLDGFNEVALSERNYARGVDPDLPNAGHMLPMIEMLDGSTLTPRRIELLARLQRTRRELAELEARSASTYSAALALGLELWGRSKRRRLEQDLALWDALPSRAAESHLLHLGPTASWPSRQALFEHVAVHWSMASKLMDSMARARNARYLHLLQPNQYHSRRAFTEEERRSAVDPDHLYRAAIVEGYPSLLARGEWLREQGVAFASGVGALDEVLEPVYADACCHLTPRGVESLADFVAASARAAR